MKKIAKIIFLQFALLALFTKISFAETTVYGCAQTFVVTNGTSTDGMCSCDAVNDKASAMGGSSGRVKYCCGYINGSGVNTWCSAYEDENTYGCGETNGSATVPDGLTCNCSFTQTNEDGTTETSTGQWESYWQSEFWNNRGICCGWTSSDQKKCLSAPIGANDVPCGTVFDADSVKKCNCSNQKKIDDSSICCGWLKDGNCNSTDVGISDLEVTDEVLNNLNPLSLGDNSEELSTPGGIISRALKNFVFPIAGLILFVVLLLGGFQMLTSATNSSGIESGKQKITSAIIGFIILFAAYWIAQLVELIFGIRILS